MKQQLSDNIFVLISGEFFAGKIFYFEKKKINVNVAVTIKTPVNNITLVEFDFDTSLISIVLPPRLI